MKRLDRALHDDTEAGWLHLATLNWAPHEARWRALGLRPSEIQQVRELLVHSVHARAEYEDALRERGAPAGVQDARLAPDERRVRRQRRRILTEALQLLETERDRHGRPLWRGRFAEVARALRLMLKGPTPERPRRGPPGEPWAHQIILALGRRFRRFTRRGRRWAAPSERKVAREVVRALDVVGHTDVIGPDRVRHILAEAAFAQSRAGSRSPTRTRSSQERPPQRSVANGQRP